MELKKVKHKDNKTYRMLFFFIGMTVSFGTVYAIMEYRKYDKVSLNDLEVIWDDYEDILIDQTAHEKPKPPKQEPLKDFVLKLVPDDKKIDDIEIDLDIEPDDDPNPDAPDLGDDDDELEETNEVFSWAQVQERAEFPGGRKALDQFIEDHLTLNDIQLEEAPSGTVAISFTIEKDGSLSDIRVTSKRKIGYGVEESVLAVFKKMPNWKPALQRDKPARMSFTKPVRLNLN